MKTKTWESIREKYDGVIPAVTYARCATDSQADNGIDAQEREMQKYADQNDITIVGHYRDCCKAGTDSNREGLQQLLQDADKDLFDLVLVYGADRLSRKASDYHDAMMVFAENQIELIVTSQAEAKHDTEQFMATISKLLVEYDSGNMAGEIG